MFFNRKYINIPKTIAGIMLICNILLQINGVYFSKAPTRIGAAVSPILPPVPCNETAKPRLSAKFLEI